MGVNGNSVVPTAMGAGIFEKFSNNGSCEESRNLITLEVPKKR
jgi:hypothetical protein